MSHRYLILGLLAECPMSGYDIKKHANAALGTATNASYGTLYPTLHKLLEEGAVEMQEVLQQGRPAKKLYRITDQGRADLQTWLRQPAAADQIRREFLLKFYLARHLDKDDLRALIAARRDEVEATFKAFQRDRRNAQGEHQAWVIDYTLAQCQAEISWLKQIEEQLAGARA